jgi:hypothetical protein
VHLYENDSNILWKHLVKFEMNLMSIKHPKAPMFLLCKGLLKGFISI